MAVLTKAHVRFWNACRRCFGHSRWLSVNGKEPDSDWRELLNRFPHEVHRMAVESMRKDVTEGKRKFVPPLPEVEGYLRRAARAADNSGTDYVRGYWRAAITGEIEQAGAALQMWPYATRLAAIPESVRAPVISRAQALLDEVCAMEKHAGKRTSEMHTKLSQDIKVLLTEFRQFACANNVPRETKRENLCSS